MSRTIPLRDCSPANFIKYIEHATKSGWRSEGEIQWGKADWTRVHGDNKSQFKIPTSQSSSSGRRGGSGTTSLRLEGMVDTNGTVRIRVRWTEESRIVCERPCTVEGFSGWGVIIETLILVLEAADPQPPNVEHIAQRLRREANTKAIEWERKELAEVVDSLVKTAKETTKKAEEAEASISLWKVESEKLNNIAKEAAELQAEAESILQNSLQETEDLRHLQDQHTSLDVLGGRMEELATQTGSSFSKFEPLSDLVRRLEKLKAMSAKKRSE